MDDHGVEDLCRTHHVRKTGCCYIIAVNKPGEFIYDVSDISVEYNEKTKKCEIRCPEFTDSIIKNMLKFQDIGIAAYIKLIEDNLELFCMGKLPSIADDVQTDACGGDKNEPKPTLRPFELPKNYKFPFNNSVTPNLKYEAMKTNVFIFTCNRISLTVECKKCRQVCILDDHAECKKCLSPMCSVFIPTFNDHFLGFLSLKGCDFVCVNPIKYQFSCARCQCNYETREIGIDESYHTKCYDCHGDIRIKVERIVYQQKKDYNLKIGTELPNRGACKHYKKSLRWFRFSCCNSLYPCDVCHDEDNGHTSEEAKRMVCGLCSKEQSVKKECECGMSLKKTHTQFWEGGKGNREKTTMSKKDSKKYRK